jgi:hypothetical protein
MLVSENTTIKKDLALGLKNQYDVLSTLQGKFGDSLIETKDKYCKWDYEDNDGNHYELKSRRVMKNAYKTTLLPCHKVCHKLMNAKQYFLFKFIDKLCYIEYDGFKGVETGMITDARTGKNDLHFFIRVESLIDIQ